MTLATTVLATVGCAIGCLVVDVLVSALGEVLGEAVAPTGALNWLTRRWWAQAFYRHRSGAMLLPLWVMTGLTVWAALAAPAATTGWLEFLRWAVPGLAVFGAIAATAWWSGSPFRARRV